MSTPETEKKHGGARTGSGRKQGPVVDKTAEAVRGIESTLQSFLDKMMNSVQRIERAAERGQARRMPEEYKPWSKKTKQLIWGGILAILFMWISHWAAGGAVAENFISVWYGALAVFTAIVSGVLVIGVLFETLSD